jgi:hypothetical protein
VYDFPPLGVGPAIPYGAYDQQRNEGFVNVGISHDTAEFAVERPAVVAMDWPAELSQGHETVVVRRWRGKQWQPKSGMEISPAAIRGSVRSGHHRVSLSTRH